MNDILEEIVAHKRKELKELKGILPLHDLAEKVEECLENDKRQTLSMRQSLAELRNSSVAPLRKDGSRKMVNPPSFLHHTQRMVLQRYLSSPMRNSLVVD